MAERRRNSKTSEGHSIKASGMIRHGTFSGSGPAAGKGILETIHRAELLETKIAAQAAEIKQLAGDNQRLASTHVAMREELVTAEHEIQRLKMHMRNLQTESDVQLRVLIDRIKRMEADIRAGESVRNDLQQACKEAQSLVTARRELNLRIQEATQELQKVHSEIKSLPDLHAELDSLRKEHQRLRDTFEYEKGLNINEVEELRAMENNLISMAREVEKLRIQVSNAEKRAQATKSSSTTPNPSSTAPNSYTGGYLNHELPYQPPMEGSAPYYDSHARSNVQMGVWPPGEGMIPQESNRVMAAAGAAFPDARVATAPSTGVDAAANLGVAAVPTGRGSVTPTSADAAVSTSRGAITSNRADAAVPAANRGASGSTSP
ncbi:protein FLX-like 4 [Humulus lupulus]|uniref:protein FLX-like 4 n=1 Tax=Humulus lupulus TaxID=3486 RepID=UPI002B40B8F5|nr:protein FLX-like 4 [Humulus lupulus]XP_062078532.1 protein FLX-like 4 [Humulus lupulus]